MADQMTLNGHHPSDGDMTGSSNSESRSRFRFIWVDDL